MITELHYSCTEYKVLCHGVFELRIACFYNLAQLVQFEGDEQTPDYEEDETAYVEQS